MKNIENYKQMIYWWGERMYPPIELEKGFFCALRDLNKCMIDIQDMLFKDLYDNINLKISIGFVLMELILLDKPHKTGIFRLIKNTEKSKIHTSKNNLFYQSLNLEAQVNLLKRTLEKSDPSIPDIVEDQFKGALQCLKTIVPHLGFTLEEAFMEAYKQFVIKKNK